MKDSKTQILNIKSSGQAMLLTVLVLGASILAASTIAGYLTLLKVRTASDIKNSAKAIFAADSGIEWELYRFYQNNQNYQKPVFQNGADFTSSTSTNVAGGTNIKSIGESNNVFRAFGTTAEGASYILRQ